MRRKKDEDDGEFMRRMLEKHPEWAHWTRDDLQADMCRLKASIEDREERLAVIYRQNGYVAPSDLELFLSVARKMPEDVTVEQFFTYLRLKPKRGHNQQRALDLFEKYYPKGWVLADEPTRDRLHAIHELREEAREQAEKLEQKRILDAMEKDLVGGTE